jgi:hypothetical protein
MLKMIGELVYYFIYGLLAGAIMGFVCAWVPRVFLILWLLMASLLVYSFFTNTPSTSEMTLHWYNLTFIIGIWLGLKGGDSMYVNSFGVKKK